MGSGTICAKCKVQVLVMFHLLAGCKLPYVSTWCVLPKIFTAKPWCVLHGCGWILCQTMVCVTWVWLDTLPNHGMCYMVWLDTYMQNLACAVYNASNMTDYEVV